MVCLVLLHFICTAVLSDITRNVITGTPRALFYPTFMLNLVQLEIAPFDPPNPKTIPCNQT